MSAIGTEQFISLDWNREQLGMMHRNVTRPGSRGTAFQEIGERARPGQAITRRDFLSSAAMEGAFDGYKAMQGQLYDVETDLGIVVSGVFVLSVVVISEVELVNASGGIVGGNFYQVLRWELQET